MTPAGRAVGAEVSTPEEAAEHYRRAVELAPIGMVCVDGAKGRYVFANQTFAHMIGRSYEAVLQGDPYQISVDATHPDDRAKSHAAIQQIAQGKSDTVRYEKRLLHSDGSTPWVSVDLIAKRDADGRLAFLTLCFTDIDARVAADSARKSLEDQLRQAQKLEALGRLAGGIAHDFNNFLLLIMGHTELLKNGLPRDSPLVSRTELVLGSAQRAGDLTRQLLAYSRRQVLKPRAFDLNAVVDRSRRLLERLIGPNIELSTRLSATLPTLADPGQIEQVILNLAINARDAMPKGGSLGLETSDATLGAEQADGLPPGEYVSLVVRDSGVGISADVLPRIFEPFFTTKEVGQGTGLGLAMVEGIVRQSGGRIQVESTPSQGTRFTIWLPRAHPVEPELPAVKPSIAPGQSARLETVLVCDDDKGVRELIASVVRLRGHTVLEAESGPRALELAAEQGGQLSLLVTDLLMPEMDGITLAGRLRAQLPDLAVLYISGFAEHATYLSGPLEPGIHFMAKPFLPSELTHTVCSILEQR